MRSLIRLTAPFSIRSLRILALSTLGALAASALSAPAALAATHTVCDAACDFTSIAAAHGAAMAGDTIDVQGTVTEDGIVLSKDLTITSSLPSKQIVQAATEPGIASDRVFFVTAGIQVAMSNLIIRHGVFSGAAGGIGNLGQLSLTNVRVEHNQASTLGGGVFSQGASAVLEVTESTFAFNVSSNQGGGIYCDNGSVIVDRSTFAKNRAFEGGAIMNRLSCDLIVRNSTISMNVGINGGAGIFNDDGGSATVESSTFAFNSLRGIQNNDVGSSFSIRNSLLGNSLTNSGVFPSQDCAVFGGGTITDLGHNLVETPGSCTFGAGSSITGVDPGLSALADYGGPTRTHALLGTSPANDVGDAGALTTDQRGDPRGQFGTDDIGAFEFKEAGEPVRPSAFCAPVIGNGQVLYAEFEAFDTQGPNFSVQIQESGGGFSSFSPNFFHHATYLGRVYGEPGTIASALYFPLTGEHYYHVIFEDGTEWANEGGATNVSTGALATSWAQVVPETDGGGSLIWAAEVGVDLPNDRYVTSNGSDPDDAVALIEHSVMSANLVYLRQAGIRHRLGRVVIRGDAGQDPYAPITTHNQYLTEVTNQWNNVLPASTHDVALVVRAGASAGLAPVGVVGDPGHSSNDATPRGDFSGVWRHEVAHNWSVIHFDGGAPEGSTINSGNALGRMSGPEQFYTIDHRDDRIGFLDFLGSLSIAVPPSAGSDRALVSWLRDGAGTVVIDVLDNDHDANGDALELVGVDTTSALPLGGTMAIAPGAGAGGRDAVRWTPPAVGGPTSAIDRFEYRVRDSDGLEATGFIYVRLVDFTSGGAYSQSFDAFADGAGDFDDGSYISNVTEGAIASAQGGALELTQDATGKLSSFTLPPQSLDGGFTASFRYRISAAGIAADGFAFNFGAPNATRIDTGGIGRFPSGLTVEFNTFAQPGIHARIDGTSVAYDFDGGLVDAAWHDANVAWSPKTGLDFSIDGSPIFDDLATPGFAPDEEDMLAFSALTIGLSQQVLIDDVIVVPEPSALLGLLAGAGFLVGVRRGRRP